MTNPPLPPLPKWATYIPVRRPEYKMHNTRGLANNAVSNKIPDSEAHIFEFVNGVWQLVFSYDPPVDCSECGGTLEINDRYGKRWGRHRIVSDGPVYLWPVVCAKCHARREEERKIISQRQYKERQPADLAKELGKNVSDQ